MNDYSVELDADEICILRFLGNWPDSYVSLNEIARRADGKVRYQSDSRWPLNALSQLKALRFVEADGHGKYRIINSQKKQPVFSLGGKKRFVSPHLRAILEKHGEKFALPS